VAVLARCVGYSLLLVLEHFRPRAVLRDPDADLEFSPEEKSSLLSRAFFCWINPFLNKGYNNVILDEELPPLRKGLKPELTRATMLQAWEQRGLAMLPCSFVKKLTSPSQPCRKQKRPSPWRYSGAFGVPWSPPPCPVSP
jgi:hypothetical protein